MNKQIYSNEKNHTSQMKTSSDLIPSFSKKYFFNQIFKDNHFF